MKCQVCKIGEPTYAYQPFGPDENPHQSMTALGNHYRGFVVIKVCDYCHDVITKGATIEFEYKNQRYIASRDEIRAIPDYVGDPLAWFELEPKANDAR